MSTVNLTEEQSRIVEAAKSRQSLKVLAFAGSGKTFTLVAISKAMPEVRTRYIAFNKSVERDAKPKFSSRVRVQTAHSMAYWAHGIKYPKERLTRDPWGLKLALQERFRSELAHMGSLAAKTLYATMDTISRFQSSADESIRPEHIPAHHLENVGAVHVLRLAQAAWAEMSDPGASLPITDDTYFKAWQLTHPKIEEDLILYDEGQDATPVMLDVVLRQEHAQRMLVGDRHQQIYAWRGAVDALSLVDLPELALTQSWRFGEAVAKVANSILWCKRESRRVSGAPGRRDMVAVHSNERPDVVLARSNAGLIMEAVSLVEQGAKIAVVGGMDSLVGFILATHEMREKDRCRHPAFRYFNNWFDLTEAANSEQGAIYKPYIQIVDTYGHDTPSMCRRLRAASVADGRQADVRLCTIHKFKGMEAEKVRIAGDLHVFCTLDKRRKTYEFNSEEANLAYVAVTRAKSLLDLGHFYPTLQASIDTRRDMFAEIERQKAASGRVGAA